MFSSYAAKLIWCGRNGMMGWKFQK